MCFLSLRWCSGFPCVYGVVVRSVCTSGSVRCGVIFLHQCGAGGIGCRCMCECVYVYVHVCVCVFVHRYVYTNGVCLFKCTHTYMLVCVLTPMRADVADVHSLWLSVGTHTHIYIYIYSSEEEYISDDPSVEDDDFWLAPRPPQSQTVGSFPPVRKFTVAFVPPPSCRVMFLLPFLHDIACCPPFVRMLSLPHVLFVLGFVWLESGTLMWKVRVIATVHVIAGVCAHLIWYLRMLFVLTSGFPMQCVK